MKLFKSIHSGRGASGDGITSLKWTESYIWNNDEEDPGELYNDSSVLISKEE